jgi:hypothetical protein
VLRQSSLLLLFPPSALSHGEEADPNSHGVHHSPQTRHDHLHEDGSEQQVQDCSNEETQEVAESHWKDLPVGTWQEKDARD